VVRWKIAQWLENIWWKNYLRKKNPEKYLNWKKSYWNQFLKNIAFQENLIDTPCIDIGCGPAGIFTILEDKNITAIDPLLKQYEKNLDIFSREKYPKVNFVTSDFESFKSKEQFKTIFCLNAINHFHSIEFSFKKLERLLDDKGTLILSIDAHNFSLFKYLFRYIPLDTLHPHQYNLKEYKNLLEHAGFKIQNSIKTEQHFFFDYWVIVATKIAK
jgi:2-polyprenyl-6-hydroxyphenyl methylase/3-demethylubiquinone-9 3-methyltransferase